MGGGLVHCDYMNFNELLTARGKVINILVSIELMINCIISQHYLNKVDKNFVVDVLNNEFSSFAFKKKILEQIVDRRQYAKEFEYLEKMNRIRNIFGHASIELHNGNDIYATSSEIWLIDPKKAGNTINPENRMKEFLDLENDVTNWLKALSKDMGINYP